MIELGMFVFFGMFAVAAIITVGMLVFALLGFALAIVAGGLEALDRALLALMLTPLWLWRVARAGRLIQPPTPPRSPPPHGTHAFRFGWWMAARWWRPWLVALCYVALMAAWIIVHGP